MQVTSVRSPTKATRALDPSSLHARAASHLLVPGALAVGLAAWDPARHGGPPLCPYRAITGHSCPGCGLTRAVAALVRGRWNEAVSLHPLAPVLVAEIMVFCVAFVILGPRLRDRVPTRVASALLVLNAIAFVAIWAARSATGQIAVLG